MPDADRYQIELAEQRAEGGGPGAESQALATISDDVREKANEMARAARGEDEDLKAGLWGYLWWTDAPDNAKRGALVSAFQGTDVLGAAARGSSYKEYTSPVDVLNEAAKRFDPEGYTRWQEKQRERLLRMEKFGADIILNPDEAITSATNPYGRKGEAAALIFDIISSPWNLIPAGLLGKGASQVGKLALKGRVEASVTRDLRNFDLTRFLDDVHGSGAVAKRGHVFSRGALDALSEQVDFSAKWAMEEAEAIERVRRWIDERPAAAADRKKLRRYLKDTADESPNAVSRDILGYQSDALKSRMDEMRDAYRELDPHDQLRAAILLARDRIPTLADDAAREVMDAANGVLSERGPLQDAVGSMFAGARVGSPEVAVARTLSGIEEAGRTVQGVLMAGTAATGRQVLRPGLVDALGYDAARAYERMLTKIDGIVSLAEGRVDPMALKTATMDEIVKMLRADGVSEDIITRMAPEFADATEAAQQVMAMIHDRRFVDKATTRMTHADLRIFSRDATLMNYEASSLIHAIEKKLASNASVYGMVDKVDEAGNVVRNRAGEVVKVKAKALTKAEEEELRQTLNSLTEAHSAWAVEAQGTIMENAYRLAKAGLIDVDAWKRTPALGGGMLGGFLGGAFGGPVGAVAGAAIGAAPKFIGRGVEALAQSQRPVARAVGQYIAEGRGMVPLLTKQGWRSPEVVFRGTGAFEALYGPFNAYTDQLQVYARQIDDAFGKLDLEGRRLVAELLEGQIDDAAVAAKGYQEAIDAATRMRGVFDELADLAGLPKEKRLSNYFPHVANADERMAKAFSDGHLPPEFNSSEAAIQWILQRQNVGREWTSRFMKSRKWKLDDYRADAKEVAMLYASSVLKSHYLSPAFKEAGDLIAGASAKTGRRAGALMGSETALKGAAHLSPEHAALRDYLQDMESVVHGVPTKAANAWHDVAKQVQDKVGWNAARAKAGLPPRSVMDDAAVSSMITSNIYRAMLGFAPATPVVNLTQNILAASDQGPLGILKGIAGIFRDGDPIEAAIRGEFTSLAKKDVKALKKQLRGRLFRDFEELHGTKASVDASRRLDQTESGKVVTKLLGRKKAEALSGSMSRAGKRYDEAAFWMMEKSEVLNRGLAFNVGLTTAREQGVSIFDAFRYGQMVSDETNFIFGQMGRGPAFMNPYLRPLVSPFTSYPAGMLRAGGRMFRQNPTAIMRYVGNFGALSSAVTKIGLDPGGQLMPWGFLPSRYMWTSGLTPLARGLLSSWEFALAEDELAKQDAAVGFLDAILLVTGLPMRGIKGWDHFVNHIDGDQVESMQNFIRELPGGEVLMAGKPPMFITTERQFTDAMTGYYYAAAKLFGFGSLVEGIARKGSENARKIYAQREKIRRERVVDYATSQNPFILDEEDRAEMNAFMRKFGMDAVERVRQSAEDSKRPVFDRVFGNLSNYDQRRMARQLSVVRDRVGGRLEDVLQVRELDADIRNRLAGF